jgi:hypothetical protein
LLGQIDNLKLEIQEKKNSLTNLEVPEMDQKEKQQNKA